MTLRRTPLARKSQLRRTGALAKVSRTRVAVVRRRRPRSTGPTLVQRNRVLERAAGCCEICGTRLHVEFYGWVTPHSFHHRQPRGSGGTSLAGVNSPSNLLLVCGTGTTGCHGRLESNRRDAYENGWLVRRPLDPATVPVLVTGDALVLLTADGEYITTTEKGTGA